MQWCMLIFVMIQTNIFSIAANGEKIKPIHWNSSNPIFFHDNTNHVFVVRILDSVDIICPKYDVSVAKDFVEYSVIHMVDKYGYDSCRTDNAKLIGFCNRPYVDDSVIIVVFREFTPSISGLEFKPGQDYYFISTSNGSESGLWQREGGLCEKKNMKLRFEVKHRHENIHATSKPATQINSKKPTKPQKQSESAKNVDDNDYDSDDYDYDNDGRSQNTNEKIPPYVISSGNGNDGTKYTWPEHKPISSASQSFPPINFQQTWKFSRVYATATPSNQNDKLKNFAPSGPHESSMLYSLLLICSLNLVILIFRCQVY